MPRLTTSLFLCLSLFPPPPGQAAGIQAQGLLEGRRGTAEGGSRRGRRGDAGAPEGLRIEPVVISQFFVTTKTAHASPHPLSSLRSIFERLKGSKRWRFVRRFVVGGSRAVGWRRNGDLGGAAGRPVPSRRGRQRARRCREGEAEGRRPWVSASTPPGGAALAGCRHGHASRPRAPAGTTGRGMAGRRPVWDSWGRRRL